MRRASFSCLRRRQSVRIWSLGVVIAATWLATIAAARSAEIDTRVYQPECGVKVEANAHRAIVTWPMTRGDFGRVALRLDESGPLVESIDLAREAQGPFESILADVDPVVYLTVGSRNVPEAKPPGSEWNVFFDKPSTRPHRSYVSQLRREKVTVASHGRRATVTLGPLELGTFAGSLELCFYADCPLVQVAAVVSTHEDRRAIIYDAGLIPAAPEDMRLNWTDSETRPQRLAAEANMPERILPVKHRMLIATSGAGSLALFPPPHQFHFPRDWTNNFGNAWLGRGHLGLTEKFSFGIRQDKQGGGAFVPWFNAPPDTQQRLGIFYLLTRGQADDAIAQTLALTHHDSFPPLDGHLTMTSHWHMAVAVTAMQQKIMSDRPTPPPEFVRMFKDLGVNMVHLAEFHGDGHQKDPGPLRLREVAEMFEQCRRLSDDRLLMIPGEEVNTFLGLMERDKHPGHWMSLFPRPVYWIQERQPEQPFVVDDPQLGKVYRVGSRQDMQKLLDAEGGLVWAAHPRIKASSWTPDIFRHEDFYLSDHWLGGAWKAMPGDLSHDRLGRRVLDLLDDMANWGQRKYVLGEVDVFKLDHTHELYGHMNVNYVRLDHLPRFDKGWQPLLDALARGDFFVTTGEMLISDFTVGGKTSGQVLSLPADGQPPLQATFNWTFPPSFAEVISGDGKQVYRQRIDLSSEGMHGQRELALRPELAGRTWVRLEVWDVAVNGAFTQPVWLAPPSSGH